MRNVLSSVAGGWHEISGEIYARVPDLVLDLYVAAGR